MSNYPSRKGYISKKAYFANLLSKILYYYLFLYLPYLNVGIGKACLMCLIHMSMISYGTSLFFAVNHWTIDSEFTDNTNISSTNWGVL